MPTSGAPSTGPQDAGTPVGRRVVLGLLGLSALGVAGGSRLPGALEALLGPVENHDPTGLVSLLPMGGSFRFYSVTRRVPRRDAGSYRLAVGGLVRTPATYGLADLQALPQTSLRRDFQCVTGWRVPQVSWSGVRLADLLDAAGPAPAATAVRLTSYDGTYAESLTLEQARRPDVLVALRLRGAALGHDHGGPVRLYVAPMYGYKSLKWLGGIELTERVEPGYWEGRGYDVDGWVGSSNGRADARTA